MEDWDDYRIFWAIATHGNLTAASRQLQLTQPSVGRRLARMEDRLGMPLFLRRGRKWALTELGRDLMDETNRMAEASAAMTRKIAGHGEEVSGTIMIATTEGFGGYWLPARLRRLRQLYPELSVELRVGNQLADLSAHQSDLALRFSKPVDPAVIGRAMGILQYGLYVHPDYLAGHPTPQKPEDLEYLDFIGHGPEFAHTPEMQWLLNYIPEQRLIFRSDSAVAQTRAVAEKLGIACLPRYLAGHFPDLIELLPTTEIPGRKLYLKAHMDLRHTRKVDAVWNFLRKEIEADPLIKRG